MTPPFRADHIGSLLRPAALRTTFRQHADGQLDDESLRAAQDAAIRDVVALQEQVGLESITDGEFRRASYWHAFVDALDGMVIRPASFEFRDDAGDKMAFTAPYVESRIVRKHSIAGEEFAFLAGATTKTPKLTMPAPSTMHFWRFTDAMEPGVYDGPEEFFAELCAIYVEELEELAQRGATYVQLDEVALAMLCDPTVQDSVRQQGADPSALADLYVDAVATILENRPPGMAIAMHMCRGNYKAHWLSSGGYEPLAERIFGSLALDGLLVEFDTERAGDFAPLRYVRPETTVVLGLVSSKTPVLEDADALVRRIEEAGADVPLERLGISPQCGFASTVGGNPLSEDDEKAKLSLVVEVAGRVWN
jgi:5-methyltetrahydropteroyltriglutamate--homocysteine methyltransferase